MGPGGIHQPFYGIWIEDLMLKQGCRKVFLGKYLRTKTIPGGEGPEAFGDGFGRNFANNQSANQNRQDAISRMSAVQESVRSPR